MRNGTLAGVFGTNRRRGSSGGGVWTTPSDITDVIDWADCSDTTKITASSNLASAIAGQRGVLTWSQATDINKPKSGVSTINSRNVLDFGSVADVTNKFRYMISNSTSYTSTGCHYWIVLKRTGFDSPSGIPIVMDATGGQRVSFYMSHQVSPSLNGIVGLFAGVFPNETTYALDNNLHLIVCNFASGGSSAVYSDGTFYSVGDPGSSTALGSIIGSDPSKPTTDGEFDGRVCAWGIGASPMGSTDRSSLLTWVQSRWGTLGSSGAFTPSAITDAIDWADCSDTTKITASSNLVSAIVGQRGVLTWSQATDINKPKSGVSTINSRNVLDFGSVADVTNKYRYMISNSTSYSSAGCHYWMIVKAISQTAFVPIIMDGQNTGRISAYLQRTPTNLGLFSGNFPNDSTFVLDNNLHLIVCNFASGATSTIYVDGTLYSVGDPGLRTTASSIIGGDPSQPTTDGEFDGRMCAWGIGASIMGATDRASLLAWARSNWGTP